MENTYWLKQSTNKPLFPDVLWSRPETKTRAGKLLIVGGHKHSFAAPIQAYNAAVKTGIGHARVLLPEPLKKVLGTNLAEADFAPSTISGGFGQAALAQMLEDAKWADGVLLAGDFGAGSETAILLEKFGQKYRGQLTFADDSLDYFLGNDAMTSRRHSVIVIDMAKLQKLAKSSRLSAPILHKMNLLELVTVLADWTISIPASFVTKHADNLIGASGGQVSMTAAAIESNWQIDLAAYASVWLLQQSQKPFEALSTAVFDFVT